MKNKKKKLFNDLFLAILAIFLLCSSSITTENVKDYKERVCSLFTSLPLVLIIRKSKFSNVRTQTPYLFAV